MKRINLLFSIGFKSIAFCVFILTMLTLSSNELQAQNYGLPNLKSVTQAQSDLMTAYNSIIGQANQAGPGSQLMNSAELYLRMVDALANRPDPNMDTKAVLLSNMKVDRYSHLVVKNGNALNMDATIISILATPEYQSLIDVLKI
ncbi:MAG: hypothetical protein IPO62_05400 [Saprospiraceae bacterium]|nr:hypothetical protein [Saprospiraceae bacterium]MBK9630490.1 hypothetical protein [Saprospiraceae bacterium]